MNLGIDLTYIPRFIDKSNLAKKILSDNEYKTYLNSPRKEEFLASRFALKEAYIKMKELSILGVDLRKIEVIKKESGAICISDGVNIYKASLSHEKDYCIGVCYD